MGVITINLIFTERHRIRNPDTKYANATEKFLYRNEKSWLDLEHT